MYGWQIPHHAESLAKQLSVSIQSTTANLEQSQETLFLKKKGFKNLLHLYVTFQTIEYLCVKLVYVLLFPYFHSQQLIKKT